MIPLAKWESDDVNYLGLIWWNRLDNRYSVEVQEDNKDKYKGTLCIFDHNDGDKLIYSQPVGVAYGAMFGADMADVNAWCTTAIQIIDSLNE